jgi:hypothetical protein
MEHRRFETWIDSMAKSWMNGKGVDGSMAKQHGWVHWLANGSGGGATEDRRFEAEKDQHWW